MKTNPKGHDKQTDRLYCLVKNALQQGKWPTYICSPSHAPTLRGLMKTVKSRVTAHGAGLQPQTIISQANPQIMHINK